MKTIQEIRLNPIKEDLNERYLRKGTGLVLARQSKTYGDRAARSFKSARERLRMSPTDTPEDQMKRLSAGLKDLSRGLEDLRNQNGAITSLVLTGVLLSERK